jgi:hypothetical protein
MKSKINSSNLAVVEISFKFLIQLEKLEKYLKQLEKYLKSPAQYRAETGPRLEPTGRGALPRAVG